MFHIVYRVTNLLNSKFYVGYHKTNDLEDYYLGSGVLVRRAIAKYGKENFQKEVLFAFDNAKAAFKKEEEVVQLHRDNPFCYNLRKGGAGGFDYINRLPRSLEVIEKVRQAHLGQKRSAESRQRMSEGQQKRSPPSQFTRAKLSAANRGRIQSDDAKRKISAAQMGHEAWNKGKSMPDRFGEKIAVAKRGKCRPEHVGESVAKANRLRPKCCWVNKEGVERKIPVSEFSDKAMFGWTLGRPSIKFLRKRK